MIERSVGDRLTVGVAVGSLTAYVICSLELAYWITVEPLFCDTAEEVCVGLSWDANRLVRWGGWGVLGVAIAAFCWFAVRRARQGRAPSLVGAVLAGVLGGIAVAALAWPFSPYVADFF